MEQFDKGLRVASDMTAVWRPTQERTTASNTAAFMRAHQIESFDDCVGGRHPTRNGSGRRSSSSSVSPSTDRGGPSGTPREGIHGLPGSWAAAST